MTKHDFNMVEIAQIAARRIGKSDKIGNRDEAIASLKDFINYKSVQEKDLLLKSVCRFLLEMEKIKQPEFRVTKLVKRLRKMVPA